MSKRMNACYICDNARVNDDEELNDYNDLSCINIGVAFTGRRFMICSGDGKPLRIEFDEWNDKYKFWETSGRYYPRFCPNCGREITEYEK